MKKKTVAFKRDRKKSDNKKGNPEKGWRAEHYLTRDVPVHSMNFNMRTAQAFLLLQMSLFFAWTLATCRKAIRTQRGVQIGPV